MKNQKKEQKMELFYSMKVISRVLIMVVIKMMFLWVNKIKLIVIVQIITDMSSKTWKIWSKDLKVELINLIINLLP